MALPIPDSHALAHSMELTARIRQIIQAEGGHIHFSRFMELALYAPGLGYYSAGTHKLGKGGDFTTAPEISPLFAQSIAQQCQQILSELGSGDMLELGAGSGVFAKDLLLELEKLGTLPDRYLILEVSAELQERQKKLLETACPHLMNRIQWLSTLPTALTGIIFANEVLDALPVTCFKIEENTVKERCVAWENDSFVWQLRPASLVLKEQIAPLQLPDGYESEINLFTPTWIHSLADALKKGVILLIDYGYVRQEYYRPDRQRGTLMCFYQHHSHDNPFIYPGLQDITAHVDFTSVVESAIAAGLRLAGYTTQAGFLLACGLLTLAEAKPLSPAEHYHQSQAIKTLTLPAQMGELVKVIGLAKHYDAALMGFELQDRRRDL